MGLDMNLYRTKRSTGPKSYEDFDEIGYWRKANAIHHWFVQNVQDGNDDCEYHEVTKDHLKTLRNLCITIFDNVSLIPGKIANGYTVKDREAIPNYIDGFIIDNQELCKELLPTQSGFFFGNTDYNQFYLQDIKLTLEIVIRALNETDFNVEQLYYCSSW